MKNIYYRITLHERRKTGLQLAVIITVSVIINIDIDDTPLIDKIYHLISH